MKWTLWIERFRCRGESCRRTGSYLPPVVLVLKWYAAAIVQGCWKSWASGSSWEATAEARGVWSVNTVERTLTLVTSRAPTLGAELRRLSPGGPASACSRRAPAGRRASSSPSSSGSSPSWWTASSAPPSTGTSMPAGCGGACCLSPTWASTPSPPRATRRGSTASSSASGVSRRMRSGARSPSSSRCRCGPVPWTAKLASARAPRNRGGMPCFLVSTRKGWRPCTEAATNSTPAPASRPLPPPLSHALPCSQGSG